MSVRKILGGARGQARAERRRELRKSIKEGVQPAEDIVDITLADIQAVFSQNDAFRQQVINVALRRQLRDARARNDVPNTTVAADGATRTVGMERAALPPTDLAQPH